MKNKGRNIADFLGILICGALAAVYLISETTDMPQKADRTGYAEAEKTYSEYKLSEKLLSENTDVKQEVPDSLLSKNEGLYAYDSLTEEEQTLYAEIQLVLENLEEDVTLSGVDEDAVGKVFQCVLNDHPELFYVEGYQITKYTVAEEIRRITFSGTYSFTREEIDSRNEQIAQYVTTCLAGLPAGADEYETVKYIYEYLVSHTEYRLEAPENQTICSVFLYGESVCQGYAKAMQYLCGQAGIESTLVVGTVDGGEGHAWNLVQIDGDYYYVDATWGDAFYVFEPSGTEVAEGKLPSINYDYLCVTTEQINATHTIDNVVPLPRCVAMEANYYVREGAYFTEADMEKTGKLFEQAYAQSKETVTIKCADTAVYSEMRRLLITEQKVFSFLQSGENTIAYTEHEPQLTMSFWL